MQSGDRLPAILAAFQMLRDHFLAPRAHFIGNVPAQGALRWMTCGLLSFACVQYDWRLQFHGSIHACFEVHFTSHVSALWIQQREVWFAGKASSQIPRSVEFHECTLNHSEYYPTAGSGQALWDRPPAGLRLCAARCIARLPRPILRSISAMGHASARRIPCLSDGSQCLPMPVVRSAPLGRELNFTSLHFLVFPIAPPQEGDPQEQGKVRTSLSKL